MSVKLDNWSVVVGEEISPWVAPELVLGVLAGYATGHPDFPAKHPIHTSSVRGKRGELVITKSGTEYELGEVRKDYEEFFPNARARLFASLPELP